ncbi:uncharacterized protein LOC108091899 [Drosophila ficusphila]|uniref:uncharacterized protein LOC108091899 n=1 Tax=Drosophila ficusphila TaxID=30025 RepID=UPI0007E65024|nr:uncharacterized protein LOC108091899 [Drosophila ficusphila]
MHSLVTIYVLILFFFNLFGISLQDNTTIAETTPATPPAKDPDTAPPAQDPDTAKPEISKESPSSKCKSTEILSENGCVDREYFLDKIIMRSWKDEGFGRAKAIAGLVDVGQCKSDEVRTPYGCAKPPLSPHRDSNRVNVDHKSMSQAYKAFFRRTGHQENVNEVREKRTPYSGPPVSGHNRPRKNYIMPGRLLRTFRQCRPYETLGKDGECHRKKGKDGHYKHTNHVYGLQKRHRHEAYKGNAQNNEV